MGRQKVRCGMAGHGADCRVQGTDGEWEWAWELKNARGYN
jgi:hypothetical protein